MSTEPRSAAMSWRWVMALAIVVGVASASFAVNRVIINNAIEEGKPLAEEREAQRSATVAQQQRADTLQQMLQIIDERLKTAPLDSMLVISAANIAYDLGAYALAERYYNRFIDSIDPSNTAAAVDRAFVVFQQGRHAEAEAQLQRLIDTNPRNQTAMYNMAFIMHELGRIDDARRWMQRVVSVDASSELGRTAAEVLRQQDAQKAAATQSSTPNQ